MQLAVHGGELTALLAIGLVALCVVIYSVVSLIRLYKEM